MEEEKDIIVEETEKKPAKKTAAKADTAAKEKKEPAKKTAAKKEAASDTVTEEKVAPKKEATEEVAETATTAEATTEEVTEKKEYKPREGGYRPREGYQPRPKTYGGYSKRPRRRVCPFCANKVEEIDYIKLAIEIRKSAEPNRDGDRRPRYITEKGRILPRRMSGVCVKHQRLLATAIKRARIMALLPFQAD